LKRVTITTAMFASQIKLLLVGFFYLQNIVEIAPSQNR
jgi:hypothetical protein